MKLHLPKMLLAAVLAAVCYTPAWAETYNLLESNANWAFTGRDAPTYDAENDTITASNEGWKQSLATYVPQGRFYYAVDKFAATIDVTGTSGVMTLALTGVNETFVLGDLAYDPATLGYGTTSDTTSYVYLNGAGWDAGTPGAVPTVTPLEVDYAAGTYAIEGTVNYTDGSYTLDLSINGTEVVSGYALGSSLDVTRITFAHDAVASNQPTLSTLTLTGTLTERSVYSTTLAEGSTNASAATWTSGGSSANYADIAMTNGSVVLDFTGADAGSTAVLDAGTNVYAIDISGGKVSLQSAEGGIATSELVVKDNATLNVESDMTVGTLFSMGSNAAVSVANNSTLDLTAIDKQVVISDTADEFTSLYNKITTEDGSFVKIAFNHSSSAELKLGSNVTMQPNIEAVGALVIHGKGAGNQFIIGEGKTLIAKGSSNGLSGMEAINKGVITISGGTVETSTITLGHTDGSADYWGKLDMTAGSLKLDKIALRNNHYNVFSVTGGELEFTSETALNRNNNTNSTITIKGADADNTVTLVADASAWTLDGTGLTSAPTVGNVTIDAANTKMITLANVALDGDIQNNATTEGAGLTLSGAITAVGGTTTTEKVMTANGYGIISTDVVIDSFKGNGNYVYAEGLTINGIAIRDCTQEGNTFTYSKGEQTGTVYHVVSGTVNMGDVSSSVTDTHTGYNVYSGATLEVNAANSGQIITLQDDATLSNVTADRCNETGYNEQQIKEVYLTGDANVVASKRFGITAGGHAQAKLDLAGHTLTKTGTALFSVTNADITAGTIDIQAGEVRLNNKSNTAGGNLVLSDGLKVNIGDSAKLTIFNDMSSTYDASVLFNATGRGAIETMGNINIGGNTGGAYSYAGDINVKSGKLCIGQISGGYNNQLSVTMTDATINLDGGNLYYYGGVSNLGTVNVKQNANVELYSTNSDGGDVGCLNIATLNVFTEKTATVNGEWVANMAIDTVTGEGSLDITKSTKNVTINTVESGFGSITNAGVLTLGTASTTVNLGSSVTNTGTVNLVGSLVLSGETYSDFTVTGALYDNTGDTVADDGATDGYLVGAGSTSFSVVSGGTINKDGITSVTYNGETVGTDSLSIANNKLTLTTTVAIEKTKDYYVNTTVDYAADSVIASDDTTGVILNGGTLNLNTALNSAATKGIVAAQDSTINIGANTTLNNSSVSSDGGTATIIGDSTAKYSMGVADMKGGDTAANNATKLNVSLGADWRGTVVFEEGSAIEYFDFNLNDFGQAGSTIQFNGTSSGTYLGSTGATYTANIDLKGGGLTLGNGFGGTAYTFAGDFTGNGKMEFSKALNKENKGLLVTFAGDMSQWTGELKHTNANGTNTYTYAAAAGKNTTIGNKITATNGTMKVNVNNAAAVAINGKVSVTSGGALNLTNEGTGALTVANMEVKGGRAALAGDMTVTSLSLGAGLSADTAAVTTSGALTLGSISLDLSSYTTVGSYSLVGITGAGSINWTEDSWTQAGLADGLTANVGFNEAGTGLSLTISEVVAPDTSIITTTVSSFGDITGGMLTLNVGADLTGATKVLISGISDSIMAEILGDANLPKGGMVGITLVGTDDKTFVANADQMIGFQANDGVSYYYGEQVGTAWQYQAAYIPEPTTATLSLLALAGLAMRRRRK